MCFAFQALMCAAARGNLRIVQMLLEAGADVKKQNSRGSKASEMAFEQGQLKVILKIIFFHSVFW